MNMVFINAGPVYHTAGAPGTRAPEGAHREPHSWQDSSGAAARSAGLYLQPERAIAGLGKALSGFPHRVGDRAALRGIAGKDPGC
jgi:hypothetical protein